MAHAWLAQESGVAHLTSRDIADPSVLQSQLFSLKNNTLTEQHLWIPGPDSHNAIDLYNDRVRVVWDQFREWFSSKSRSSNTVDHRCQTGSRHSTATGESHGFSTPRN